MKARPSRSVRWQGPLSDREILDQFADEPILLALADAVFATQPAESVQPRDRVSRGQWPLTRSPAASRRAAIRLGLAGAIIVGISLLLVAPWRDSSSGIIEAALAAVDERPVLRVVIEAPTPLQVVDSATGRARRVVQTDELLYDRERRVLRTTTRMDGRLVSEALETPAGGSTSTGPIHTCSWIAQHPLQAKRLGLSCPGGTSRGIWVGLDPALAGFLDSYEEALRTGVARSDGAGVVDGHAVEWLVFPDPSGIDQRVAVKRATGEPLVISRGGQDLLVEDVETLDRAPHQFGPPQKVESIPPSAVVATEPVYASDLAAGLPGAYRLAEGVTGLALVGAERQTVRVSDGRIESSLVLLYGAASDGQVVERASVHIVQSTSPLAAYGWGVLRGLVPAPGTFVDAHPFGIFLRLGRTYVSIRGTQGSLFTLSQALILVRALEPWR